MDEIAMAVIAAINDAIDAGLSSTEEIIDAVVTAVLGITGIEDEDFEEVVETVMNTIQDILGIEEDENIVVDDQIEDENLSVPVASEIMEEILIIFNSIEEALEEENDGSGEDITKKLILVTETSIKKSVSEELSTELVASSVVMMLKKVVTEESENGQDVTFNLLTIYEAVSIVIKKVLGVNDVVEVVAQVSTMVREFLSTFNNSSGTVVTEIIKTTIETSLQQTLSASGLLSVSASDISNVVIEALRKTVELETTGGELISFDITIIINAAKAIIVQYLGVDIFISEVTSAIDEIISIGGNGSGEDITELLITTVKTDINKYLGDATESNNKIVTAQRLAYFMRLSLIKLISKVGSFEELSYDSEMVTKSVSLEIKGYFEVLTKEDEGFSIMDVIDGAVATICSVLGMCPGQSPPPPPLPEPTCSEQFIRFEDTCIHVSQMTTARNWVEAQIACTELHPRANLASIHTVEELDFIRSNCSYIGTFFLGGTDAGSEGVWKWNNEQEWNFENWRPGQPAGLGRENCMEMDAKDGFWNDVDCGGFAGRCSPGIGCKLRGKAPPKRYVCSYPLVPQSLEELLGIPEIEVTPECGQWEGIWPQNPGVEGDEMPSMPVLPSLVVVQAPNVPIQISNSPESNIPIVIPPVISIPVRKKKLKSNKNVGRKDTKKNRSKKNKSRMKSEKREKKNSKKRLKKKKEKMHAK